VLVLRTTLRKSVYLHMKGTNNTALFVALSALAWAFSGCASQPSTARPTQLAYACGPGSPAVYGAYGSASYSDAEGLFDDASAARQRAKHRAPAPWPFPQGWAVPQAWPFPWLLPPGKAPSTSPGAPAAVAFAKSRLGTPYCWGGTGPACYDCSGLTSQSWKAGGKAIPRTSEAQVDTLPEVALDQIRPGDILWRPGHVALYVGDGQIIHAPHTGDVVRYAPAVRFQKAVRP